MKVETRSLDSIKPYPKNPRVISETAIEKVAASLREFGWRQPIVVDEQGVIVVGHARYLAAQKLGWTEAPVHVAEGLTPAQVRAYRIMDNRSNQEARWDEGLLSVEIGELKGLDIDLTLTGFSDLETELENIPELEAVDGRSWLYGARREAQIKVVLYTTQVSIFEKALRITGNPNRGEALIQVCQHYLDEKGQFDLPSEGAA